MTEYNKIDIKKLNKPCEETHCEHYLFDFPWCEIYKELFEDSGDSNTCRFYEERTKEGEKK